VTFTSWHTASPAIVLAAGGVPSLEGAAHTYQMKPPVRAEELQADYRYGLGFITVVIVGLFLQKGSNTSVFWTLLWMALATTGCLMINTSAIGVVTRGRSHQHRLRRIMEKPALYLTTGFLGAAFVVISFMVIDNDPSHDVQPPSGNQDSFDTSVSLRDPQHAKNDQSVRFLVTIANQTPSRVLLNQAEFSVSLRDTELQCSDAGNVYSLTQAITVRDGSLQDVRLEALEGPFSGYSVEAHGSLTDLCQEKGITLRFPVSISLAPTESAYLALDIPRRISITEDQQSSALREQTHLAFPVEVDSPGATFSFRVRYDDDAWACISKKPTDGESSSMCASKR
jgi:hypothetical protein